MKKEFHTSLKSKKLAVAVSAILLAGTDGLLAQEATDEQRQPTGGLIEEIAVIGRARGAAQMIQMERVNQPYSAEVVGIEQISRAGDSDVALALRRVTGLTLVDNKFIYVRGLGERYSSATLNNAEIPSPELSRNVIPLDLFPASILESVKVHKAYSADQPAAFGGGNINIRTRSVPASPLFQVSAGTGWNSENSSTGLTNLGDQGELPTEISQALNTYQGDISPTNITSFLHPGVSSPTPQMLEDGVAANRELMLSLNRDIELEEEGSLDPNLSVSATGGTSWDINNDFTFGFLASAGVSRSFANKNQRQKNFTNPERDTADITRTFETENTTAALNMSLDYQGRHILSTNSYLLQNDEDQASIVDSFNNDFLKEEGRQRRVYLSRLEQRELLVNQVMGQHILSDGDFGIIKLPREIVEVEVNWFYSDSTASTTIPNASSVQATNILDEDSLAFISSQINAATSTQFNFLDLEDQVISNGFRVDAPFELGAWIGTISAGATQSKKGREFIGWTANISSGVTAPRSGTPGDVFADNVLNDLDNDFTLFMGSNFGTESYVAGETKSASFGSIDMTWDDRWRLSAGVRWENFKRGVLPINLLDYTGSYILDLQDQLSDPNQTLAVNESDYYPAVALTWINDGFMDTSNFQVRLGYGKTVVRPDLREFANIQYIDPELNNRVEGNPNLVFSDIDHYDLRTEFFWDNGDSFTVSLFYKDIANPIERVERPGPEDAILLSFDNAISGEIYGVEVEGLKEITYGFFVGGNVVLSDSEIQFDANTAQTSQSRRLTGHSEYAVNVQLGYDSNNAKHSASLLYNVFGERIFFGGLSPSPDAFEQPFHSLDLVYSWFPTDNVTLKLRAQNILNETRTFEQGGVTIIEQDVGVGFKADLQWEF